MAFYGHLFLQPGQQGDDPGDLSPEEAAFADALGEEWLVRGAERSADKKVQREAVREVVYLRGQIGAQEQGLRHRMARPVINSLARVPWFARLSVAFAERFVRKAITQVTRYLTNDSSRETTLTTVTALLDVKTKIVIGHSLGSVIAYEAMHRLEHPLPLLVTLGSPLGLQTIVYQRLRPQSPGFPPQVQRWVNVADRNDLVAAEPDLVPMFSSGLSSGALFESGYKVDNGAEPHRADFYLTKAQLGKAIGETLSGS
jgi:hypothetical protein